MARSSDPIWLAAPSRFAGLSRKRARWALALLGVLVVACLSVLATPDPPLSSSPATHSDVALYESIVEGVRYGGDYYTVTADALRAGGYPMRPFVTFRLPALAEVQAHLPDRVQIILLDLLAFAVVLAWGKRLLEAVRPRPIPRLAALLLLLGGMMAFVQSDLAAFHEIWAAQFVALSLALRRPGRWVEAVALGVIAVLIRETALPYLMLMGATAWLEGERREASGWGVGIALFAVVMVIHAIAVARVTGPLDPASPGWSGLHGIGLFVKSLSLTSALTVLPLWLAALLVALSLFGWLSWNSALGLRVAGLLFGYAVMIGIFARLDTFYWGLMITPVFLVGLAFAPDGLRDCLTAALDRRRVRVQIVPR